jgi:hypothetical protein
LVREIGKEKGKTLKEMLNFFFTDWPGSTAVKNCGLDLSCGETGLFLFLFGVVQVED